METSFYEQAEAQSLWGLFINAGYLTIDHHIEDDFYCLKIPNQEVQKEFKSLTAHYLQVSSLELENLYFALRNNKEDMFKDSYQRLLKSLPSPHDLKDENNYY